MISCTSGCLSASFCMSLLNWTRQGSTMVACENPNTYFLLWALIWNGLNTVDAAAAAILVLISVLRFVGGFLRFLFFLIRIPKLGTPEIRVGHRRFAGC